MDEAQEILLNSLRSSGISLPSTVSSVKDLTPDSLVSICSQFFILIDGSSPSFPSSLPSSMADRFKICEDMSSGIKDLGYRETLSFHQFLYPSEEDSYKLVRFLVVKLSESSEGRRDADNNANNLHLVCKEATSDSSKSVSNQQNEIADEVGKSQSNQASPPGMTSLGGLKERPSAPTGPIAVQVHSDGLPGSGKITGELGGSAGATELQYGFVESDEKEKSCNIEDAGGRSVESENPKEVICFDGENVSQMENKSVSETEEKLASLRVQLSKLRDGVESLQCQEKKLVEAKHVKALQVQKLEHDYETLKAAVDMALDDQHSVGYFIKQLNEQVESRRHNIMELESQWNCLKQTPEERKMTPGLSSHNLESGVKEKLDQLKEIEQETMTTISEINRRELEYSSLLEELQNVPKVPPRKSYIQRITEITKNSWKQDADIDRILKETRELQLESNSIRERLDRTYVVVDETVYREAKKDARGRMVYRLLTSIHDSFEQISDKILAADRARREAAEQEAKLTALSSRSIDIDKLQSDLDPIRKENEFLEQKLRQD